MDANTLLADPSALAIEKFVPHHNAITIVVRSTRPMAFCPQCHQPSSSLKTRYSRRLADLPWHGVAVGLQLLTRKFRCRNQLCQQKVFCERLPTVVEPFARRTLRLSKIIELLAFALGARPGVRAATNLAFPIGKDACLRIMRRSTPAAADSTVSALGVDDFAFRKGCTYGTILVDLDEHQPIDLLPDRTAETLAEWLKAHPEIQILSRDRSSAYADAARRSTPQAEQVADRWHLLKNLGDLVERFFVKNHCLLARAAAVVRAEHLAQQAEVDLPAGAKTKSLAISERPVPVRRQTLFNSIKELQAQGKSLRRIARELKIARNTVRRYIDCEAAPPQAVGAGKPSSVLPFAGYLEQRWSEGEHNAFRLWQELAAQGYRGGVDAVQRFVREWRQTPIGQSLCPVPSRGVSPRRAAKLLLDPESIKDEAERIYLGHLRQASPSVQVLERLGIGFQQLVKERRGDLFDEWLRQVRVSGIQEIENWADGLLADEAAVRNALSLSWSNGQVEGQVNRLKTIKRQMYGRAKFDLLRARVLYRA